MPYSARFAALALAAALTAPGVTAGQARPPLAPHTLPAPRSTPLDARRSTPLSPVDGRASTPRSLLRDAPADTAAPFTVTVTGHGRPMLLVPGLMSGGAVWDGVVARYRDRYELHVLTLAGFAGAPPLDSVQAPRFLAAERDAIIRYIRERRLDRPVLVGHSLGGFLALWVAADAPDLVGPVIAVDGVPYLMALGDSTMTPERARPQAGAIRAAYAAFTPAQVAVQTRLGAAQMTRDPARATTLEAWARTSDPATVGRAVAEMMTTDLRDSVAAIRAPVLLVGAGNGAAGDALVRVRASYERQLRRVPDARVVIAADARHFVMWDDPAALTAAMDHFLGDRP
ncbi:MAG TPA: alpha/beta hydrolase [Gemmatimonadaceae bacterium]|nr:alpha/beta hydrolase [Gemmatimonadaceae bacterium]